METHYYLINGTVKKGGEMPDGQDYMQTRRISFDELEDYFDNESYDFDKKRWLSSLQPCEISETLMSDLTNYLRDFEMGIYSPKPTNISDLVYDNNGVITFKQPQKIQIGDKIEYTIDNKNTPQLHGKTFRVKVASIDENNCYVYAPYGQDIVPIEQAKLVGSKQPKQVESECEAVEFAEWMYENRYVKYFGNDSMNCDKWYKQYTLPNREYYTTKQLYEIFKNRK